MPARYLPIYLNDHLAGSTAGVELTRRTFAENRNTDLGEFLSGLLSEIEEDRATLINLMQALSIKPSAIKVAAAWTVEKAGRLSFSPRDAYPTPVRGLSKRTTPGLPSRADRQSGHNAPGTNQALRRGL